MFNFKEQYGERLRLIRSDTGRRHGVRDDNMFNSDLRSLLKHTITMFYNKYNEKTPVEAHIKAVMSDLDTGQLKDNVTVRSYREMYRIYHELMDGRDEDLRLDRIDRDRYIAYRLATTIGIALIVFFLYWIAGCLGVKLPAMPRI